MGSDILYLDGSRDRAVEKALRKYGKVCYAEGINEAVEFIADREFDYYFLDADIPYVRELLAHLEHDPYFVPPKAFVLLTDNEVEDCGAWKVDTFITRSRIKDDLPFVFSHLVGEPPDNNGVLRLVKEDNDREMVFRDDVESAASRCAEESDDYELSNECGNPYAGGDKLSDIQTSLSLHPGRSGMGETGVKKGINKELRGGRFPLRLITVGVLTSALLILLYTFVPIGSGSAKKESAKSAKTENGAAEANKNGKDEDMHPVDFVYGNEQVSPNQEINVTQPAAVNSADGEAAVFDPGSENETAEAATTPSSKYSNPLPDVPVNNPPSVSISGPAQVPRGQTVTYAAVACDPDGDAVSYSWGSSSRNMSWSAPGLFTVSVTVTDSRGASGSASISVRVI